MALSLAQKIGLDLGSCKSVIALAANEPRVAFCEPTLLGVDSAQNRVEYFGNDAYERAGKVSNGVEWVRPIRRGAIADYAAILYYLKRAFSRSLPSPRIFKPTVMATVPIHLTSVAVRALGDAVREAGGGGLYLVPSTIASAVKLSGEKDSNGVLVVDFGEGVTDISVIAFDEIVVGKTVPMGGRDIDATVQRLFEFSFGLKISEREAEAIKKKVGVEEGRPGEVLKKKKAEAGGSGVFAEVKVPVEAVTSCIRRTVAPLVEGIASVLEETPPELFEDIFKTGIFLTGGSSRMPGLKDLLESKTRMDVKVPPDPELTPIQGVMAMLRARDFARRYASQITMVP